MDGYLGIDVELGGPDFISRQDAILEIALLDIPDPFKSNYSEADFITKYLNKTRVKHFLIKPYANVNAHILHNVLNRDLSYYENGKPLAEVANAIKQYMLEIGKIYGKITPVSDWHGDVIALDYILSNAKTSVQKLIKQHNMLHIKSFVIGIDNFDYDFARSKRKLGVKELLRTEMHSSDTDCINTLETFVRATYLKKRKSTAKI